MTLALLPVHALAAAVPLDPDQDEATDWLIEELGKQEYQTAKPTLWDQMAQAFWDWVDSLFSGAGGGAVDVVSLLVIGALIVLAILLVILFVRPTAARRSRVSSDDRLFLDDDHRTAAELRAAADTAAAAGDWALAVTERYRAIARDLGDRTLIAVRPGSTAHDVASRATTPFPGEAEALEQAARDFDDVRYLDRAGSEAAWRRTRELDTRLASSRPAAMADLEGVAR